ncbi:Fur family transcriptional regulator [Chryseobacterium sp. TY3]
MTTSEIEKILENKNIPITPMRQLVLAEFLKTEHSISLAELEEILETADRSTIYRTLKTFEKKGLIHSIQENHTTQYLFCHDNCNEDSHHDYHLHFFCTECKNTVCLENINFQNVDFPKDYVIKELKFVANGICKSCVETLQ